MAKKKKAEAWTPDEQVGQTTLEANVAAEEATEHTVDARVAAVFHQPVSITEEQISDLKHQSVERARAEPRPDVMTVVIPPTPEQVAPLVVETNAGAAVAPAWVPEAREVLQLMDRGDAVSPGALRRLLVAALAHGGH